ncbi:MAG: stage II sporulation protein P [Thermoanaerobacterales bacterium]|nr:stage II sporulation protein P [Thermoanaerobacterales bacterium]
MNNKAKLGLLIGFLAVAAMALTAYQKAPGLLPAWAPAWAPPGLGRSLDEMKAGEYSTVLDDKGAVVTKLGRHVKAGNEIINSRGEHYRITRVRGNIAEAEMLGVDRDLLAWYEYFDQYAVPAANSGANTGRIAVYHSHSDESYIPTDGKASIPGNGGIYHVGASLTNALQGRRVPVLHSLARHDPHDAQAYMRSRKTAVQLLKQSPAALIDVHRDGVPDPDFYRRTISGRDAAQLRLVIGSQNPNMNANKDFARRLMAFANKTHPGLVKEIFIGSGNYNQDLMPTAILVESGTYTLSRQRAQEGVALLADAIPTVLGVGTAPRAPTTTRNWGSLAWIIVLTIVAAGAFLVISSGGWSQARSKFGQFFGKEFGLRLRTGSRGGGREGER